MRHANPTFKIGERERNDLVKAWLLTSVAFAVFFVRTGFINTEMFSGGFLLVFLLSAFTAGVGFVVHELCHKIAAHHFRAYGEFVANSTMLIVSILFAFLGFLFAAPGAVHIMGRITKRENGIISAAGPASNMVLVLLFLPLAFFAPGFFALVGIFGVWINALLGAFNMIPFLGLDGSKILAWSVPVYVAMVVVAGIQVVLAFTVL